MKILIHTNPHLAHQVRLAGCFVQGFKAHGLAAEVTPDPAAPADVHVVLGPHYALRYWQDHPRCLQLDRRHYGDETDGGAIAWRRDGRRIWPLAPDSARWDLHPHPLTEPRASGLRGLILGDYQEPRHVYIDRIAEWIGFDEVTYRPHPQADRWPECPVAMDRGPLDKCLSRHTVAYGRGTTALVAAVLAGLDVECDEPDNIAWSYAAGQRDRESWCYDLAYANWTDMEIASGAAWEWLNGTATDC